MHQPLHTASLLLCVALGQSLACAAPADDKESSATFGGPGMADASSRSDAAEGRAERSTAGRVDAGPADAGAPRSASDAGSRSLRDAASTADGAQWLTDASQDVDALTDRVSGFASQAGKGMDTTSGGGGAAPVVAETCMALQRALQDAQPRVVMLPARVTLDCRTSARPQSVCVVPCDQSDPGKSTYRIAVPGQTCAELDSSESATRTRDETQINVASDKTLLGQGATLQGVSLNLSGSHNIIIRQLTLSEVNPTLVEGADAITLKDSHHIWIDHCRFRAISDGHVDIERSSNVTISWNHFDGRNAAVCGGQHHYVHLVADSQVTFHHNFYDHTSGRNPKLEGTTTRSHLYNNHYQAITYFAIGSNGGAEAKIEGNFFDDARRPHWRDGGKIDAPLSSNRYTGRSASVNEAKDTGDSVFSDLTLYPYVLDPVERVPAIVERAAGPD